MLPTNYQQYIALSRYARWRDDLGRRETWEETVDRYINFFKARSPVRVGRTEGDGRTTIQEIPENVAIHEGLDAAREAILSLEVMPSMRCLMTAGEALDRDNVAGFNCSYAAVDSPRVFDEILYVLMCGTGVGFSVERQYIQHLPVIAEEFHDTDTTLVVADSKIGWAKSFRELVSLLYQGQVPKWDVSKVRAAGERLKTFGGRASGPQPLVDLFEFTVKTFKEARGRRLSSIECHDIVCKVADIVVVGGVRRSALISLSNLTDTRMRHAKENLYYQDQAGGWYCTEPQRALANNSVAYTEKPDVGTFLEEWRSLYESRSGERGIFNRVASQKTAARNQRRDASYEFGTNPCSEIILRPKQFCNLSEVVVRPTDTLDDLKRKVRLATILGTLQATLTDFRYLSKSWKQNTEEEALLGVSLTGIMDHPVLNGSENPNDWEHLDVVLTQLKEVAIETNSEWADRLGINPSAAITCVKPSGTVSQLVDSASGIHPRYSSYYIRTVRTDKKDPLYQFMLGKGFYIEDAIGKESSTAVIHFPMKAPKGAVFRNERSAIEQLELWKVYAEHWCEHKPSVTIYVKEDEWMEVGAWVYKNFDILSGVSFLPYDGGVYQQAPYQEVTKEQYEEWVARTPKDIDWSELCKYEHDDQTVNTKELACVAGVCEI